LIQKDEPIILQNAPTKITSWMGFEVGKNTCTISSSPVNADQSFATWRESRRTPILILAILAAVFWTLLLLSYTVGDAFIKE